MIHEHQSSVIAQSAYSDGMIFLTFFNSGQTYRYDGTPLRVHEGLLSASSIGRYFSQHIRDQFTGVIASMPDFLNTETPEFKIDDPNHPVINWGLW